MKNKKKILWKSKALKLKLDKKYYAVYQLFLKDTIEEIVKSEWDRAMDEIEQEKAFQYNAEVAKKVKNMLTVTAKEVDSVTDSNLLKAIGKATNEWLSPYETKAVLEDVFKELKTTRLDKIIRTESIRYWTFAEQEAWTQSWVVKYKERWTAIDERTCETCWKLHGKKIPLNDNFFKKGDKFWNLKLDYEDIKGSPLHPNCRCDMIPCLE